ncbi:hypothetical protein EUGRSUZ_G00705 [Eucalyptus grandis]|uniref:Uncharacterized protein n=2 Tax=Eucalyptus grandis TaxID=71139 RepID=A0ACC3K369_EUCGR|nr:hypothetical protein EUGRSUZ_G00705 [Eucalyptus grandis]
MLLATYLCGCQFRKLTLHEYIRWLNSQHESTRSWTQFCIACYSTFTTIMTKMLSILQQLSSFTYLHKPNSRHGRL